MRAALIALGISVQEFYGCDPYEISLMMEANNERRRREHESQLRMAAFIVNAVGTRSQPLDIEQLLSGSKAPAQVSDMDIKKHEAVVSRLMAVAKYNKRVN